MKLLIRSFVILLWVVGNLGMLAQTAAKPPLPELWAKLQVGVDTAKAKPGDALAAIASDSWVYRDCGVSAGARIAGKIVKLDRYDGAVTRIAMRFDAPCENGANAPLVLIAMFYAVDDPKSQMETFTAMPQGIGPGASGRQSTNLSAMPTPGQGQTVLPVAKVGELKGMRHMSLGVGAGEKGSTVLSTSDKRLRVQQGTRLAFLPVPVTD